MPASKARVTEIIDYALIHGDEETCRLFGLASTALDRYRRKYKEIYGENSDLLFALKKQFTEAELKALLNTSKKQLPSKRDIRIPIDGEVIKFGVISDTHIGHKEFKEGYLYRAFDTIEARGCTFVVHSGDVTEGLMNRPGHFYECSHYGYKAQRDEAIRVLSYYQKPLYLTSGNHDGSLNSKLGVGVDIVEDICDKIPNAVYLPGDPADITIDGVKIRLFHGRDRGGSFAKSHRGQKIVDSFGADIPDILITGHDHAMNYCKYRGGHIIDAGSIQRLTDFQRGNKLTADVGFWVIEATIRQNRIVAFSPTFYDLEEAMNG